MTAKELAEKDLQKATFNLALAIKQTNVDPIVIENLARKCALREEILKILEGV